MTTTNVSDAALLRSHLARREPSDRLQAVMAAGTRPDPRFVEALIARCAVEPDFYVRDMLTWAIARHSSAVTVSRLITELAHGRAQARSQALHSLSKIGDPSAWSAITDALLRDGDDEVARSAWRAAVVLVPPGQETHVADVLVSQFGRGDREVQLSLSRALVALGEAARPAVSRAGATRDDTVRTHVLATERLLDDPDESFDAAVFDARRIAALGPDEDR